MPLYRVQVTHSLEKSHCDIAFLIRVLLECIGQDLFRLCKLL